MSKRTWQLDRRTWLRGVGVACSLPYLEAMTGSALASKANKADATARMCFVYFPNGASLPPTENPDHADWSWFPLGEGADYRTTKVLESLNPLRERVTVLGALSHPNSRIVLGHLAGDT